MPSTSDQTAVLFALAEERLAGMEIATGPCVPAPGRSRPLVSPLAQHDGEQPRHTAALLGVLGGEGTAEAALQHVEAKGSGSLFVCKPAFVEALANAGERLQRLADEDDSRGDADLTEFTKALDALDRAWLTATDWPVSFVGTRNRLAHRLGPGSEARNKCLPLWAWYGQSVPQFVVTSGQGQYPGRSGTR